MTLSYQPPATRAKLLPVVKEIIFWENKKGTESHCLARIFEEENQRIAIDRKSTRLNSSHVSQSRMPSSA